MPYSARAENNTECLKAIIFASKSCVSVLAQEVVFSEVLMIGGERPVIGHPLVNMVPVVWQDR